MRLHVFSLGNGSFGRRCSNGDAYSGHQSTSTKLFQSCNLIATHLFDCVYLVTLEFRTLFMFYQARFIRHSEQEELLSLSTSNSLCVGKDGWGREDTSEDKLSVKVNVGTSFFLLKQTKQKNVT